MLDWVNQARIAPEAVLDSFMRPQPRLAALLNERAWKQFWYALAVHTWRDLIGGEPFYWGV
jgi:hypothetical protein